MDYKGASHQGEGNRQKKLEQQRKTMEEDNKRRKEQIIKDNSVSVNAVGERFTSQQEDYASALAKDTVGLVTLQEFEQKKKTLAEKRAADFAAQQILMELQRTKTGPQKVLKQAMKNKLSFSLDDEEEEEVAEEEEKVTNTREGGSGELGDTAGEEDKEAVGGVVEPAPKRLKISKNPFVDTSFLPDREREAREQEEREHLALEWRQKQEEVKKEEIEITFSYWDGSGHRSSVRCKKGDTISTFLERTRQQFPELRGVSVDNLIYIKEDLIIPQHHSFYDFIVNKARGKSGPLFHFDFHDDVRMIADARVERDESHAGKVTSLIKLTIIFLESSSIPLSSNWPFTRLAASRGVIDFFFFSFLFFYYCSRLKGGRAQVVRA